MRAEGREEWTIKAYKRAFAGGGSISCFNCAHGYTIVYFFQKGKYTSINLSSKIFRIATCDRTYL